MLTRGSLCSGIDGLALGVERALGCETVWQAEIDPHASTILARHWPDIPNLGDITTVDWAHIMPVDLLIAGPPCQPVSQAGRRNGTKDERWLWPAVLDAVRVLRPPLVLFENPMGLLTGRDDDDEDCVLDDGGLGGPATDSGWFGDILWTLADLRYSVAWRCFRSSDVGAPHRRQRVFICGSLADPGGAGTGRDARTLQGAAAGGGRAGVDVHAAGDDRDAAADAEGERWPREVESRPDVECDGFQFAHMGAADVRWGVYEPAVRRWEAIHGPAPQPTDDRGRLNPAFVEWMLGFPPGWVDGIPRTAQLRVLGNSVQPQVAELATRVLLALFAGRVLQALEAG